MSCFRQQLASNESSLPGVWTLVIRLAMCLNLSENCISLNRIVFCTPTIELRGPKSSVYDYGLGRRTAHAGDAKIAFRGSASDQCECKGGIKNLGTYQENLNFVQLPTMSNSSGSDDASWKNNKAAFERYRIMNNNDLPLDCGLTWQ